MVCSPSFSPLVYYVDTDTGDVFVFVLADFQALEMMLTGGELTERRASQTPDFSEYLRSARRRHRHRMEEVDPTGDSPLPLTSFDQSQG